MVFRRRHIWWCGAVSLGSFPILGLLYLVIVGPDVLARYDGVIVERVHERRPRFDDPLRHDDDFYLVIRDEDGFDRRVSVSPFLYGWSEVGDPVEKRRGRRYPTLMSERAIRRREAASGAWTELREMLLPPREEPPPPPPDDGDPGNP